MHPGQIISNKKKPVKFEDSPFVGKTRSRDPEFYHDASEPKLPCQRIANAINFN